MIVDLLLRVPELAVMAVSTSLSWRLTRFLTGSRAFRVSSLQACWVRVSWRRLARVLGLVYRDPNPPLRAWIWRRADPHDDELHLVVPRIRIAPDRYGVIVRTRALPHVGRQQWENACPSLAASWRMTRVAVVDDRAGRLVIRGVRRDPLTISTTWRPTPRSGGNGWSWQIGVDEFALRVSLQLRNVAGVTVAGLPGSGKSSLLSGLIATFAPSPLVQFVVLDGKGSREYDDVRPRLSAFCDDDLEEARNLLLELVDLRRHRARLVRDFWQQGPTDATPLVIVIVDEAHSYLQEIRGTDQQSRQLSALASENRRLLEDLTKKGRSAGFLTIPATQKATGDSLPTAIRDVCAANLSFAQSTSAASVAALGESIRDYPHADPMQLQGPAYVGVLSMRADGRPGFTRVRAPCPLPADVARICSDTRQLARPLEQLHSPTLTVVDEPANHTTAAAA